jgi:hypothetical protein
VNPAAGIFFFLGLLVRVGSTVHKKFIKCVCPELNRSFFQNTNPSKYVDARHANRYGNNVNL